MIGLILIYFLGKAFYDLAANHEKNKWGNAIAGVAIYYAGTFIVAIAIGFYMEIQGMNDDMNDFILGLICMPFGLLACWLFYNFKKKRFENGIHINVDAIDSDFLSND